MEKNIDRYILTLGLFILGFASMFSGMLIQVNYHMGNHGNIAISECVFGINYHGWSAIHKIAIAGLSVLMVYHVNQHWKWYNVVFTKKNLIAKNKQVLILSLLLVLVAITGFTPWFIDLLKGVVTVRKAFIEIHDKLAIILSIYLILHIIKRLKWFLLPFRK